MIQIMKCKFKFACGAAIFSGLVGAPSFAGISTAGRSAKEVAINAITEIFFKRNPDAVDLYVAENYIQRQPGLANGRKPFKDYLRTLFKAYPDYRGEIENVVAEGDLVSFHIKWIGTHLGEFMGVKPTGKKITRRTADVLRIESGRIVEHWGIVDQLDMMKMLGLLNPPIN